MRSDGEVPLLDLHDSDGVAVIRLNDPSTRNAVSAKQSRAVAEAVEGAVGRDCGAIVVTAAPPVFSAGGAFADLTRDPVPLREMYEGFLALAHAPIPTLAVVDGPAVGAGVNFALVCDVVLSTPRAVFDPRFIDSGMHPGGGHLWRMERRIGRQATAATVLFGETLDGAEAVEYGLAWRCVDSDHVMDVAMDMAHRAAARDRELVVRTKSSMVAEAEFLDPMQAVTLEWEAQAWALERPEFAAQIQRVKERIGTGARK